VHEVVAVRPPRSAKKFDGGAQFCPGHPDWFWELRGVVVARRQSSKIFKRFLLLISEPYVALAAVFAVVACLTLFRVVQKHRNENKLSQINISAPVPVEVTNPLTPGPWDFFHPVWKKSQGVSFFSVLADRAQELPDSYVEDITKLVEDPQQRLEKEFQVPAALKTRVAFWLEIYTRYSSRIRVIHDRSNMGIIYGYIDLRPIYRSSTSMAVAESKAYRIEQSVLKELKSKMSEAIGLTKTNVLSAEERGQIRAMLSNFGALSPRNTQDLISTMRTQSGQSDMFLSALYRAKNLLPHIESVFRRQKLPVALARIPFVESSFNVKAQSKIGAVGIWQFTRETAQQMIHTDEEKMWSDPIKQTASAARLLNMYRSLLPDWGTTVTSYNSGVGRLRRLSEKYKIKHVEELFKVPADDALGFAGNNFYAEFLAANLAEAYKEVIFSKMLLPVDFSLVFKGVLPFPKDVCDL
jgi:hypothetical protein